MTENSQNHIILIVDDSFINRALLKKTFENKYDTLEAVNGVEALSILNERRDISAVVLDIIMPELDGFGVLKQVYASQRLSEIPVLVVTANDDYDTQIKALELGAADIIRKPFKPQIVLYRIKNLLYRRELYRVAEQNRLYQQRLLEKEKQLRLSEIDQKSGTYNKQAFYRRAAELIKSNPDCQFAIIRSDIDRFKLYNDMFGIAAGDALIRKIGEMFEKLVTGYLYGHLEADHFVACLPAEYLDFNSIYKNTINWLAAYQPGFQFVPRLGAYLVDDPNIEIELMCDRALLALRSTKNSFTVRWAWYDESMMTSLLEEQEIINEMEPALLSGQFKAYIQPQYNYSTGRMSGAEVLVRWHHPQKGLLLPRKFIKIFEHNGFISRLDEYIWEQACILLRKWLDEGYNIVPLSVNISRHDFYNPRMYDILTGLIEKYSLSPNLLHLEITESAYVDDPSLLINIVERLRNYGFIIEMDDFGSEYSSLNTLKDVPVDLLKLDMKFVAQSMQGTRGGNILSSVVRMAHWLELPVISEGIETKQQADYMKSIGCFLMQGFHFAKPMPVESFEGLLFAVPQAEILSCSLDTDIKKAADFLDASTQISLLFNYFVGAALIIEYDGSNVEALRMNDKFFKVMGTTLEEYSSRQLNVLVQFNEESRNAFINMLEGAMVSGGEEQCELYSPPNDKTGKGMWLSIRTRFLSHNVAGNVFFVAVENITELKELRSKVLNLQNNCLN